MPTTAHVRLEPHTDAAVVTDDAPPETGVCPMARVLLVEDNDANADMLSRRLNRVGFDVVVASDGLEALAVAKATRPALVLMDISLPKVDGWEATRRLKADGSTAAIPVIALTAHAMVADRQRCLDAGCDEFETKPIDMKRLLAKMQTLLDARPTP